MRFIDFLQHGGDRFVRYLEFKAHQDGVGMDEAASRSLGRLFSQVGGSPNTLVIMTAFRSENTLAINRSKLPNCPATFVGLAGASPRSSADSWRPFRVRADSRSSSESTKNRFS